MSFMITQQDRLNEQLEAIRIRLASFPEVALGGYGMYAESVSNWFEIVDVRVPRSVKVKVKRSDDFSRPAFELLLRKFIGDSNS